MPSSRITYIRIDFFDPYGPPQPLFEDSDESRKWFTLVDEVLTSYRFPCLQCVCISLEFHPEDAAGISNSPFPLLKARGILYLNIEVHASPFEMQRWLQAREVIPLECDTREVQEIKMHQGSPDMSGESHIGLGKQF